MNQVESLNRMRIITDRINTIRQVLDTDISALHVKVTTEKLYTGVNEELMSVDHRKLIKVMLDQELMAEKSKLDEERRTLAEQFL